MIEIHTSLHFEVVQKPLTPQLRTVVCLDVPRGFLEVLQAPKIYPSVAFDQLAQDLKDGLHSFAADRWRAGLQRFHADWHPFIQVDHIECGTMNEDVAIVKEVASLFDLPLAVVWVGTVTIGLNLDRSKWFPRPARQDRRRPAPENAVFFPGVKPWGIHRRQERQHA